MFAKNKNKKTKNKKIINILKFEYNFKIYLNFQFPVKAYYKFRLDIYSFSRDHMVDATIERQIILLAIAKSNFS